MAVTYVKNFSFPSDFGFHKNGSASVPGKGSKPSMKMGGKVSTPQPYRKGGEVQGPQAKYAGHTKKSVFTPKTGAGARDVSYKQGSDHIFKGSQGEKTSGMQAPAFKHGGKSARHEHMMKSHMERRAKGGSIDVAEAPVKMGAKSAWNKDDAVSPGSSKRTTPKQGTKNSAAAREKFATEGRNTEPATKQVGDVERMSGFSDFKKGGKVKKAHGGHISTPQPYAKGGHAKGCGCKMCSGGAMKEGGQVKTRDRFETSKDDNRMAAPDKQEKGDGMTYKKGGRIKNLGKYAHGGKVWTDGSTQKPGGDDEYEKAAGTPKKSHDGSKGERSSGKAEGKSTEKAQGSKRANKTEHKVQPTRGEKMGDMAKHNQPNSISALHFAGGGLTRGTSAKRNAAIHAHEKQKMPHNGLGALAAAMGAGQPAPPGPGMGPSPPGMAPGMGGPPGAPMGGQPPGLPGGMAHGGKVTHVVHHVIRH
jgi:hypothetical protein